MSRIGLALFVLLQCDSIIVTICRIREGLASHVLAARIIS